MAKWDVQMNSAGAIAILTSPEVQEELRRRADAIASHANSVGSGTYEAADRSSAKRARSIVKATDAESMADNAKNNTLLKSLDAGR